MTDTTTTTQYAFFWKTSDEHGYMAQWAKSPFQGTDHPASLSANPITYPTAEHYMMAHKAFLFNDLSAAREILKADSPRAVKSLGRKVKNFDDAMWTAKREEIVYQGNLLKFGNNPQIRERLLGTGERVLVEASPKDAIWGIGFAEDHALEHLEEWGENLLGKALMRVRDTLRSEGK